MVLTSSIPPGFAHSYTGLEVDSDLGPGEGGWQYQPLVGQMVFLQS